MSASLSPVVTMHTLPLHNIPPPLRKVAVVAVVEDAEECGPPVLRSAIVEWIRKNTSSLKVCVCLRLRGREENRSESAKRPHIPPRPSPRPLAACCAHASTNIAIVHLPHVHARCKLMHVHDMHAASSCTCTCTCIQRLRVCNEDVTSPVSLRVFEDVEVMKLSAGLKLVRGSTATDANRTGELEVQELNSESEWLTWQGG